MKIDKIVTQLITQEQTGSLSNIKTKNLIIKEITIRETEKGSLEFRTTITNKEITMEWECASNAIKMGTFPKIVSRLVIMADNSGKGKTEIIISREEIITSRGSSLKKMLIEIGKIIETEINIRI